MEHHKWFIEGSKWGEETAPFPTEILHAELSEAGKKRQNLKKYIVRLVQEHTRNRPTSLTARTSTFTRETLTNAFHTPNNQADCGFGNLLCQEIAMLRPVFMYYLNGCPTFPDVGLHRSLWAGSWVARVKFTVVGTHSRPNYCVFLEYIQNLY
jgi:hypothetical protein